MVKGIPISITLKKDIFDTNSAGKVVNLLNTYINSSENVIK